MNCRQTTRTSQRKTSGRQCCHGAASVAHEEVVLLPDAIRSRFASFGGIEISLPQRDAVRKAPEFEE